MNDPDGCQDTQRIPRPDSVSGAYVDSIVPVRVKMQSLNCTAVMRMSLRDLNELFITSKGPSQATMFLPVGEMLMEDNVDVGTGKCYDWAS